jgi:hypothetical protein
MQRVRISIRTDTITNILPKLQAKKTYHTMKLIIVSYADERDYFNSRFAKMQTSSSAPASKGKSAIKKYDYGPAPSADAIYQRIPKRRPAVLSLCRSQFSLSRLLARFAGNLVSE